MLHFIILAMIAISLMLLSGKRAYACTGFAAGKKASADGSLIIGRTEDIAAFHPKHFDVVPACNEEGARTLTDPVNGFSIALSTRSCRWTMVSDIPEQGDGLYPEACMNEYGVCISATVSTGVNEHVQQFDPLVKNGLREAYLPCVVIPYVKTAREGVLMLGQIIESYGSAEGNTVLLADANEAWIMEIVSGHQWAAQKVPDDCCAVIPNCMMLGYIDADDSENYLCSEKLFSLPAESGCLRTLNGLPHAALTYGPAMSEGNRVRAWGGRHLLAPAQNTPYDSEVFSLFFRPDQPLTLMQCMQTLAYRYEGTAYDANLTHSRAIGTETTCEAHLFQLRQSLPPLQWLCMGTADNGLFLPCYEGITRTPHFYRNARPGRTRGSAYWTSRTLSALTAAKRPLFGQSVRTWLNAYQQTLIEQSKASDACISRLEGEARSEYADHLLAESASAALHEIDSINRELMFCLTLSELPAFLRSTGTSHCR